MTGFQRRSELSPSSRLLGSGAGVCWEIKAKFCTFPFIVLTIQEKKKYMERSKVYMYIYSCSLRAGLSTAYFYVELNKMHLQT